MIMLRCNLPLAGGVPQLLAASLVAPRHLLVTPSNATHETVVTHDHAYHLDPPTAMGV